jgi:hypothetical protein
MVVDPKATLEPVTNYGGHWPIPEWRISDDEKAKRTFNERVERQSGPSFRLLRLGDSCAGGFTARRRAP